VNDYPVLLIYSLVGFKGSTHNVGHMNSITKVSASDFGKSIAPKNIVHLFDHHFRLWNDNKKTSGLGLRLYVSAEIVRPNEGDLGVKSEIDKGKTFWFTIPDQLNNKS
jgi:signal transduction histidine kinase